MPKILDTYSNGAWHLRKYHNLAEMRNASSFAFQRPHFLYIWRFVVAVIRCENFICQDKITISFVFRHYLLVSNAIIVSMFIFLRFFSFFSVSKHLYPRLSISFSNIFGVFFSLFNFNFWIFAEFVYANVFHSFRCLGFVFHLIELS